MKKPLLILLSFFFSTMAFANPIWVDVRSQEEYDQNHIEGDIRISHEQIVAEIMKQFPDKDTEIHLYCRSGRRAGIARSELIEAGYKNVSNAGGINEVRKSRALSQE